MGRAKAISRANHKHNSKAKQIVKRRQHSQPSILRGGAPQKKVGNLKKQQPLKVPFDRHDHVLLLGEGDFSFALSLSQNYKPAALTATCYDNEDEMLQKYLQARTTVQKLVEESSDDAEEWDGFSTTPSIDSEDELDEGKGQKQAVPKCRVLYGIDATKLSTVHRKQLQSLGPFSKIVFNFPHVGGLSTNVNRQVRANQQLLVGFFNSAKALLSGSQNPLKTVVADSGWSESYDEPFISREGQILVTLFEGEPYSLWNVRDLARHCGLQVVESFKFPWHAYPSYQHARTIGDITTGKDRAAEGVRMGGWRGEERDARCYVLEVKENTDVEISNHGPLKRHRRGKDGEDDSD